MHRALWYNYATWTSEMQNFQINTLIQLLTSSTIFERHRFILRKTVVFAFFFFCVVCLMHWCKQSSRRQSVFDTSFVQVAEVTYVGRKTTAHFSYFHLHITCFARQPLDQATQRRMVGWSGNSGLEMKQLWQKSDIIPRYLRDFKLLPPSQWDLRSCGILCSVVSYWRFGCYTLEDGTDRLS